MKKLVGILLLSSLFNSCFIVKAQDSSNDYLRGKFYASVKNNFLVATEKMNDNRFAQTVIMMLESDQNGAWGLVINKPLGTMPIALLIDPSLNTSKEKERERLFGINVPIYWGGPVDVHEIFILHSTEYQSETTKRFGDISISQDYNILFDIARSEGPKKNLIILGYSGWGSGQLEGEMEKDSWVLSEIDIDQDLIFKTDNEKKWSIAIKNSFIRL
jgi:putative transcriptional regulator